MTKVLQIITMSVTLAACAHTTTGFRQQAPKFEMISDKKPETVLGCITEAWGPIGYTKSYTPLANGGSVSLDLPTLLISTGNKIGIVDAEGVNGHTRVRFYGFNSFRKSGNARVIDAAKACL